MKNLAAYLLLLTAVMLSFSACSDDDDKDKKKEDKQEDYSALLSGRWVVSKTRASQMDAWRPVTDTPIQIEFGSEGECTVTTGNGTKVGTFDLSGKDILVNLNGGSFTSYEIIQADYSPKTVYVAVYKGGKTSDRQPDGYYRMSHCPDYPMDVWDMLRGNWMYLGDLSLFEYSEYILSFSEEEGEISPIYYFPSTLPETATYYDYRGKYVYWHKNKVTVTPNENNPSMGVISYVQNGKEVKINYSNLCYDMWTSTKAPVNYIRFDGNISAYCADDL